VHGGRAGFHPKLEQQHLDALFVQEKVKDMAALLAQDADEAEKLLKKATTSACKEYLACLYLRMSDNVRYEGLKTALNNAFLLDGGKYPTTLEQAL
jgi:hypothetical protein